MSDAYKIMPESASPAHESVHAKLHVGMGVHVLEES